jgi:hypothetical protein
MKKNVFEKVDTVCAVCGTPLTTPNEYCIGNNSYCVDDFQRELEESRNRDKFNRNKKIKKIFKGFGGEL